MLHIAKTLQNDGITLSSLSLTCRTMYTLVSPTLWSCLCFDRFLPTRTLNLTLVLLTSPRNLAKHVRRIEFVNLDDGTNNEYAISCPDVYGQDYRSLLEWEYLPMTILSLILPRLREVNIQRDVSIRSILALMNGIGHVKTLELGGAHTCGGWAQTFTRGFKREFTHFSIFIHYWHDKVHPDDDYRHLSVRYAPAAHSPRQPIETLDLSHLLLKINRPIYNLIADHWDLGALRNLDLSFTNLTTDIIARILPRASRLEMLVVSEDYDTP
ncbi:hypothetical protein HDV00_010034 [Rhizophlyctis rosea]|nr:hypothetical protein HDV00_010034 [Rhizophlyctis rosea]